MGKINNEKLLGRDDLHSYQEEAVKFIKKQAGAALFLGLG